MTRRDSAKIILLRVLVRNSSWVQTTPFVSPYAIYIITERPLQRPFHPTPRGLLLFMAAVHNVSPLRVLLHTCETSRCWADVTQVCVNNGNRSITFNAPAIYSSLHVTQVGGTISPVRPFVVFSKRVSQVWARATIIQSLVIYYRFSFHLFIYFMWL